VFPALTPVYEALRLESRLLKNFHLPESLAQLPSGAKGKTMTLSRVFFWALGSIFVLAVLYAICMPNLMRSRVAANRAMHAYRMQHPLDVPAPSLKLVGAELKSDSASTAYQPKLIRKAELQLLVTDVRDAASQVEKIVSANGGQVDNLNLEETEQGSFSGTVTVRIPSAVLEEALAQLKSIAIRTQNEHIAVQDVTHEYYDSEAHLRNLHAEEQQYLAIMKQSGKIPDTLQVAQHLSDVRDRIERQQAAIQVMSHDVEMSQVGISLSKEANTKVAAFNWRPLQNARAASRQLLEGLSEWFDSLVTLLIKLPLVLVWLLTVAVGCYFLFVGSRWTWRRVRLLFVVGE
jgi:hypothetical protein